MIPDRHRVTVQRLTVTGKDEFGADIIALVPVATVHATIQPLTGREFFDAQQTAAQADIRVRLRTHPDLVGLKAKDQILFGTRVLDIQSVVNVNERGAEYEIMAKELV